MADRRLRLGDILIEAGLITDAQLASALEAQKKGPREGIGTILVKMGFITEKNLVTTLSHQLKIPYATREEGLKPEADPELQKRVPHEFAHKHFHLQLSLERDTLTLEMADPMDLVLIDNLRLMAGCKTIKTVIAPKSDIEWAIEGFYGSGGLYKKAVEESYLAETAATAARELPVAAGAEAAEAAPVVKMTDLLLKQAIKERASDIHIEPFRDTIGLRYRIDGVLREVPPPAKSMALPIVSRIKVLAKMDIAERRLPQDGSFSAMVEGRSIDFRVSTVPTLFGEKIVMRILDRSRVSLDLGTLGFEAKDLETVRAMIRKPYGLILLTGPTGSGKTTTLYAALNEIRGAEKNILTIEDPVEYQMSGVNQVQAKPEIGLTFAVGLRSFLRQDPDIILVGEIRDLETAQICVRASLTGHLVFSTLHTNDAPSAVSRLIDIGIEPFFVSSSLRMIVAQRLVRRLCPACKAPGPPSEGRVPAELKGVKTIYTARGCEKCGKAGYLGRLAIYEILCMNDELERLVSTRAPTPDIFAAARRNGFRTLAESGYAKVAAGETTLEEVHGITLQ